MEDAELRRTDPFAVNAIPTDVLSTLVEKHPDLVVVFLPDGTITYANEAITSVFGWPRERVIGGNFATFLHPDDLERALEVVGLMADDPSGRVRITPAIYRILAADGSYRPVEFLGPKLDPGGFDQIVTVGRYSLDAVLQQEVFVGLTEGRPLDEVVALIPRFGEWRHPDDAYALVYDDERGDRRAVGADLPPSLVGLDPGDSPITRLIASGSEGRIELEQLPPELAADAQQAGLTGCWIRTVPDPLGGRPAALVVWAAHGGPPLVTHRYALDVMERVLALVLRWRQQVSQLHHAALHDQLTGVGNRTLFFRRLDEDHGDAPTAVLYVDLDDFKPVNDQFGHPFGDRVLVLVAERIANSVRPSDVIARLGGDEFAVLCRGVEQDEATGIAGRIIDALHLPFELDGHTVSIGASIGIAFGVPDQGDTGLLDVADRALYRAKAEQKGSWRLTVT